MHLSSRLRPPLRLFAGIALLGLGVPAGLVSQAGAAHAQAPVYLTVNTTADNLVGDCTPSGSPCSLREAVQYFIEHSGDTVNVYIPSGTYHLTSALNVSGYANGTLNLNGASESRVVIDAQGTSRAFVISGSISVTMRNLTIENGYVSANNGGGIQQNGAALSLTSVTVTGSVAYNGNGGGMFLAPANTDTLTAVTVDGNGATNGGGIYVASGTVDMAGGTVENNIACTAVVGGNNIGCIPNGAASKGGGIQNGAKLNITSATIKDNWAGLPGYGNGYGAGIENEGTLTVDKSTISGNDAFDGTSSGHGGGVENNGSAVSASISDSTIESNFAGQSGGGIYSAAPLTTFNDRILNNQAGGCPSGIACSFSGCATITDICLTTDVPATVANGYGGGIDMATGSATERASYISGNVAVDSNASLAGTYCG
ncbi:MAG: CSLREA domain-containing protein, partial [Chloroflexota bacterium]